MDESIVDAVRRMSVLPGIGLGALGLVALFGEYSYREITRRLPNDFTDEPSRWELPVPESLALRTRDGLRIASWLFTNPTACATVVILHGHGANKHLLLPLAHILNPAYNVLLLDSRGHGESDGTRTTIGYEERIDVLAVVDELERRQLGPIGIWGTSMGAVTALLAAAEDERIVAILADSPYARLRHAVAETGKLRGYPTALAPALAYVACWSTARRLGYQMAAFDPIEIIDRIAPRPLLLIHGEHDEIIPLNDAYLLYAKANQPKDLWVIPELQHCRALEAAYEPFCNRVREFFGEHLSEAALARLAGIAPPARKPALAASETKAMMGSK